MKQLLFINWHDDDLVDIPMVNEQHHGLIATVFIILFYAARVEIEGFEAYNYYV